MMYCVGGGGGKGSGGGGGGGGGGQEQWDCGKSGTLNFQRVGSIVRDIGDPCLSHSHIKVSRILKPEKWQACFDSDGKVSGFHKALKLIVLGGVDPSIRPEVWEFLLGCYAPGSTAEYRKQLRIARRERYEDLIKQCQVMHSSIGTGSLAYVVGSKVMDMRTSSKDDGPREAKVESGEPSVDNTNQSKSFYDSSNNCTDISYACQKESSIDSADLVSVRESADSAAYDSSCFISASGPCNCSSLKRGREARGSPYVTESYIDFPPLPVTDLFEKNGKYEKNNGVCEEKPSTRHKLRLEDDRMHSFQIANNADLIMESNGSPSNSISHHMKSEIEMASPGSHEPELWSNSQDFKTEITDRLRISDAPDVPLNTTTSPGEAVKEERVSEWLWTLHRIVVDVVRTDSHLEFYEDAKNLARMSDILAVYAWVDPATGYCQGMSDLLSPFVVLFEDNADAFWCFEMLLRRMRNNFQMEGPTGVMKQLEELWHILELTDREMYKHLSNIGAESLHFAFRMLLVLFRRELSFNEALCMWEMMWAADYDEASASTLEEKCLEQLVVQLSRESVVIRERSTENSGGDLKGQPKNGNIECSVSADDGIKSASAHPFCGLTRTFWSRNGHSQNFTVVSSTWNVNEELPVFCVAAILIMNRHKVMKETRSIDDMIKIFNDNLLKIHVRRCVRAAIKTRKKYFYKLIKSKSHRAGNGE